MKLSLLQKIILFIMILTILLFLLLLSSSNNNSLHYSMSDLNLIPTNTIGILLSNDQKDDDIKRKKYIWKKNKYSSSVPTSSPTSSSIKLILI